MSIYRLEGYAEGTEDDAIALRKSLAQSISDNFELKRVFGVSVELDEPQDNLVMSLCMTELDGGLDIKQFGKLLAMLRHDKKYMTVDFCMNNSPAYGFVEVEFFKTHYFRSERLAEFINPILDDMNLETPDGFYKTPDGQRFYMGNPNTSKTEPSETGSNMNPFRLKVSIDVEVTAEDIDDLMCTALEGGICHWCSETEVVGDYLGKYAHEQISRGGMLKLHDAEEDETYELDRDKFLRGLKMFIEKGNGDLVNIKNKRIDPADFDSENADCIIQYALFGELVFG